MIESLIEVLFVFGVIGALYALAWYSCNALIKRRHGAAIFLTLWIGAVFLAMWAIRYAQITAVAE